MALTYPFPFPHLEISPQELKVSIEGKVRAIWASTLTPEIKKSIEDVLSLLGRSTNTSNSNSDQRRSKANANYQETGALPNQTDSPVKAQAQDPGHYGQVAQGYHDAQKKLFELLIKEKKLLSTMSDDGSLMKGQKELTCKETCNALDEATKKFFNQPAVGDSITTGVREGGQLTEMYNLCNEVVTKRMAANAVKKDDLLQTNNNGGYKKWKNHVYMIASLAALMVSLDVATKSL